MIIQFDHNEIVQAITEYTRTRTNNADCSNVEVNLTAGRGTNGFTASVSFDATTLEVSTDSPAASEESAGEAVTVTPEIDDGKSLFDS